jgi:hypothetical protein
MPTPLTDAQLDVLFRAALPFQPATRVQFLEAVMSALSQESSSSSSSSVPSDDLVYRVVARMQHELVRADAVPKDRAPLFFEHPPSCMLRDWLGGPRLWCVLKRAGSRSRAIRSSIRSTGPTRAVEDMLERVRRAQSNT